MTELLDLTKPIDKALEDLADRQRDVAKAGGLALGSIEDPHLGPPPYDKIPCSIYFYYVRVNNSGRVFISHHFYPGGNPDDEQNPRNPADWPTIDRDPAKLTPILEMLAHDARPTGTNAYKIGGGFQNILWRRKSYIAFFIDEANWTLHPQDGVNFVTEPKNGVPGTPNHTFFDALYLPLRMRINGGPATDLRSAVVFINHMKADDAGNDLTALDPPQLFHFQMVFDVAIEGSTNKMTVIFDPDGSNQGPPLGPP